MQSIERAADPEPKLSLSEEDYDFGILHPAFRRLYGDSDLYNYGYWRDAAGARITDLPQAARRLVALHAEADPDRRTPRRVFDVGCGLGACTAQLAAAYPNAALTGVNYSRRQIDLARSRHGGPRVTFCRMDATDLRFDDGSVDRIHCIEAAMHFRPRTRFLAEAHRLLAPGGRLILSDVLTVAPTRFLPRENVLPTVSDYAQALRDAGFEPVLVRDLHEDTVIPFAGVLSKNAMTAYARGIVQAIHGYVLAVAVRP